MSILAGYGVASPTILGLLFATGAWFLTWIYRRKGSGARIAVGSLFIFKRLPIAQTARQKFEPPPRFFLELFLIFLLGAGVAGLFFEGPSTRHAIIVDNSLSMRAAPPDGASPTLLESGIKALRAELYSGEGDVSFDLFVTSPRLTRVLERGTGPGSVDGILDSIRPTYGPDRLEDAVQEVSRGGAYDLLTIVTDRDQMRNEESSERFVVISPYDGTDPRRAANVGIVGASLTTAEGKNTIVARFLNSGTTPATPEISILLLSASGERVREIPFDVTMRAGETVEVTKNVPESAAYEVSISPSHLNKVSMNNSLDVDDSAWLVPGGRTSTAYFVSEIPPERLRLNRIPKVQFQHVTPQNLPSSWFDPSSTEQSVALFYKAAPVSLPRVHSLFLLPPPGENREIFRGVATARGTIPLSAWESTHPILSYAALRTLAPKDVLILASPSWASPILTSTKGPLITAGIWKGFRYAAVGLELLPYEGAASPLSSIVLLNALSWLSNAEITSSAGSVGTPIPVSERTELVRRILPDTETYSLPPGKSPHIESNHPGLYLSMGEGGSTLTAINVLDEGESRTHLSRPFIVPTLTPRTTQENDTISLARWAATALLLILALDALVTVIRRRTPLVARPEGI